MNIYLIRRTDSNKGNHCMDPCVAAVVVAESEDDARSIYPSIRWPYIWSENPEDEKSGMCWTNGTHENDPGEWVTPDDVEVVLLGRNCVNKRGVVLSDTYYNVHGLIDFAESAPSYPGLDPN